jgi:hypothetical protein
MSFSLVLLPVERRAPISTPAGQIVLELGQALMNGSIVELGGAVLTIKADEPRGP